jgi:hypothetical protein
MDITELKARVEAIQRGEYEHFAFDPRVDYHTAVMMLSREVQSIAWQAGYKEEAQELIAQLKRVMSA